jgi:hypothetical protein
VPTSLLLPLLPLLRLLLHWGWVHQSRQAQLDSPAPARLLHSGHWLAEAHSGVGS